MHWRMQNQEKAVIMKPVASRAFSSFSSFSKLLEDPVTVNGTPASFPEVPAAIRPKTVRLKCRPANVPAIEALEDGKAEEAQLTSGAMEQPQPLGRRPAATVGDRPPSYDGYNWRKYGQKQVKGSEFPRSYYKCTHPDCPVKKKVERSPDGEVAEIVYRGEHSHPKPPRPPKKPPPAAAPSDAAAEASTAAAADGFGEVCEGGGGCSPETVERKKLECKRSKKDDQPSGTASASASIEPPPASQSSTELEIAGDGFHWRKYGQKVVKGNPYPRSYYRCTIPKCSARKYVERVSDGSGSFVTTYEGRHDHYMPI